MFDALYRWAMRTGSRLLFALALILPCIFLLQALSMIGRFGPNNDLHPDWLAVLTQLFAACSATLVPLLGALLIERADRFLALRERGPASGD